METIGDSDIIKVVFDLFEVIVDKRSCLVGVNFALFADTSTMTGEFNSTSEGILLLRPSKFKVKVKNDHRSKFFSI